jgi:hypothetical protein
MYDHFLEEKTSKAFLFKLVIFYYINRKSRLKLIFQFQEEWLCVSRLPLDMTGEEFLELLQDFGPVKQHFLVYSETTGNVP